MSARVPTDTIQTPADALAEIFSQRFQLAYNSQAIVSQTRSSVIGSVFSARPISGALRMEERVDGRREWRMHWGRCFIARR